MPAQPLVSIVVPCYRAQATLEDTVDGVLAQSFSDWELVLFSDDGHDYLADLHASGRRDSRLRQVPLRTWRTGHVAARTRGLAMARGTLIADLDSDDIWQPERLAGLVPLAPRYGAAQDALECFDDGGTLGCYGPLDGRTELLSPGRVTAFDMPFHLLVHRDLVGRRWFPHASFAPDPMRAAVIAARAGLAWLGAPMLRYRVHTQSMSQSASGSWKVEVSYGEILRRLTTGDAYGLAAPHLAAVLRGFRRKRRLNRQHMARRRADPATAPFISWVLSAPPGVDLGRPFG